MLKKVEFEGWKDCVELVSGKFKLIVTTAVGPRIMGGFVGKSANIFNVDPKLAGTSGASEWVNYGGHRLWHSPEMKPRTYYPDNGRAAVRELKDGVEFTQGREETTGVYKSMTIYPLGKNKFRIEHLIRNEGMWDIEIAAWALSVMAPGGVCVAPQNREDFALLPNSFFAVWPYTDMSDPRYTWGKDYILVRQDAKKGPCKIGFNCKNGWLAYANRGTLFVKRFEHYSDCEYPDNGCSVEIYTNKDMLEAETLSPLSILGPSDEILHVEEWECSAFDAEIKTEKDAAKYLPSVK